MLCLLGFTTPEEQAAEVDKAVVNRVKKATSTGSIQFATVRHLAMTLSRPSLMSSTSAPAKAGAPDSQVAELASGTVQTPRGHWYGRS